MINFNDLNEEEKTELSKQIEKYNREKDKEHILSTMQSHKRYTNTAYKLNNKYYYILSVKSTDENKAECVVFDLDELPKEAHYTGDRAEFSNIIYEGLHIEDVPLFEYKDGTMVIEKYTPVSIELYFKVYRLFMEKFENMILRGVFDTYKGIKDNS